MAPACVENVKSAGDCSVLCFRLICGYIWQFKKPNRA